MLREAGRELLKVISRGCRQNSCGRRKWFGVSHAWVGESDLDGLDCMSCALKLRNQAGHQLLEPNGGSAGLCEHYQFTLFEVCDAVL